MATLTMTQFLKFLQAHCMDHHLEGAHILSEEKGRSDAYDDIRRLINIFLQDYAEQKKLTNDVEEKFLKAIETDQRREFDDPVELIEHIEKIASKQPFFNCERISLAAIQGFCNDFLHGHRRQVYQEQLQQAAF